MADGPTILVVDDEPDTRDLMAQSLSERDYRVVVARDGEEALAQVEKERPDLLLLDLMLPKKNGYEVTRELKSGPDRPFLPIIMLTAKDDLRSKVTGLEMGVDDYLTKPIQMEELVARVKSMLRIKELHDKLVRVNKQLEVRNRELTETLADLRRAREDIEEKEEAERALSEDLSRLRQDLQRLGRLGRLVGRSKPIQRVYELVQRVAPSEAPVLITGESGTGKEVAARTIHDLSKRARAPFVGINCGAIPATLIESELFGHEKGAFTGAVSRREGYFEQARGGTLFLDEITETPLDFQVRLLRVLEEKAFMRVGGKELQPLDCRVLSASNRDPRQAIEEGKLREDLYYRLNVFPIALPPLRERAEDLELLCEAFVAELNAAEPKGEARFHPTALALLRAYDWPGNVRELRNVVQRAYILSSGGNITVECLPEQFQGREAPAPTVAVELGRPMRDVEAQVIQETLFLLRGDKPKTAASLGISLKTLYNKIKEYGLAVP